ncbi:MAG: transcription termination factor NusA [Candidatus Yonathbacteria bacterium RIFCSPHIGHO2_01_FULL_51_10]|uniref:Transcription termination/antitermination protein NusA n=1 Tax=Candidatus Yonathbacteria bacterium RIFCSPHIGHO2_01_FULL_51_10 TaxID=1802723 RepID=A0A1G2S9V5_9BACT|nr:MAG: transcription termination factor NusA [Candidatus Yonathbacteria bacterium RIFCSPHIGHO2_01_FULL_51_10]
MMDLKVLNSALHQLEEERGIPKEKIVDAIEQALAAAYKKDYGKKGQIVRTQFDLATGTATFSQVKIAVDESMVRMEEGEDEEETPTPEKRNGVPTESVVKSAEGEEGETILPRFNSEQHILIEDARRIKKDVAVGDELIFPLEMHDDYGRIAAQTAKQVIIQRIREAEKVSVLDEYGKREGEIVSGSVQRIERGNIFVDLGKATGILPYEEQVRSERYRQGERIKAYLYSVEETPRGINLRLSRSHPQFLKKLFEIEAPEIASGVVEIKAIAREAGSRSKVAVFSNDDHIDPVGSCVGQRGVRVSTVMSELSGEKIDLIEWSLEPAQFIEDALSPARVEKVELLPEEKRAIVKVSDDEFSLAIGKGGQNVRLAAKLTGWKIDIQSAGGAAVSEKPTDEVTVPKDESLEDEVAEMEGEKEVETVENGAHESKVIAEEVAEIEGDIHGEKDTATTTPEEVEASVNELEVEAEETRDAEEAESDESK